ncbi:hypothetical protein PHLCEN_2v4864 [Hermanssonia centrifuga]|uniref:Uncharacterized protein n=1 Tax=Hermanssonia centrifuga TaxID=98765 RepID=A0A2R6PG15_9APHY|nr:hypothetical protein PHLCEN_2v4864 [Hermanssonia centrifuga]
MHLFRFLPSLVALLAFLLAVNAKPRRGSLLSRRLEPEERSLTNFERLKRNLPPRAPVLNRVLPGREALEPTPAWKIRRASPSPSASSVPIVFTGRIEIKRTTGQSVGYLNNTGSAM